MRRFDFINGFALGALFFTAFASSPLNQSVAHEEHKMDCSETGMNAMQADIQAMRDGEAKTKAMKEMDIAKGMMVEGDMDACMIHMHNAMEAIEE
jgi:hypothetical protein